MTEKTDLRTKRTAEAREYHKELLEKVGVSQFDLDLKVAYNLPDSTDRGVGIFANQFQKKHGCYFELVTGSDYTPVDPKRTVYKVPHSTNYDSIYPLLKNGTYGVPLEELDIVTGGEDLAVNEVSHKLLEIDLDDDDNVSKMTIMDFAAIHWKKPVADKPYLNAAIKKLKE